MPNELTETAARLQQLEQIVAVSVEAFLEAGRALAEIRDSKLYVGEDKTFELYLKRRWNISKAHAYRLIDQAKLHDRLSPIGDAPQTQSHLRALGRVPEEKQSEVWEATKAAAGDREITANLIEQIAADIGALPLPEQPPEPVASTAAPDTPGRKIIDETPCPNCGAHAWQEDGEDWLECGECRHPYGEPADDPQPERKPRKQDEPRDIVMDAIDVIDTLANGDPTRELLHRIKLHIKQLRDAIRQIV